MDYINLHFTYLLLDIVQTQNQYWVLSQTCDSGEGDSGSKYLHVTFELGNECIGSHDGEWSWECEQRKNHEWLRSF